MEEDRETVGGGGRDGKRGWTVGQGRTACRALEGGAGGDVELHVGYELHLQLQTHGGLDEDEEGGGLEDAHIRCSTGRGQ